jgi:AraC-like DNA-binding protein
LLFFFVKNYISEKHNFKPIYLFHLLPFIADHIYQFFYFYFQSGGQKIIELNNIISGTPSVKMSVTLLLASVSPVVYCIWSIIYLSSHRQNLKKLYSFTSDELRIEWLWYLTWSMFVVGCAALILNAVIVFFDAADWVQLRLIILVIASIWVFSLGYYSVKKTPFYRSYHIDGLSTVDEEEMPSGVKYEKTRLKEDEIPGLKKKLLEYLTASKPYLNKNLSIGELAESLEIPAYQLSQLINDRLGQSFFEFINNYRVEEVKLRFFEPKFSNLTLPGIALECGFNSKASFNRIFKQLTGQTPTEYIKAKKAA